MALAQGLQGSCSACLLRTHEAAGSGVHLTYGLQQQASLQQELSFPHLRLPVRTARLRWWWQRQAIFQRAVCLQHRRGPRCVVLGVPREVSQQSCPQLAKTETMVVTVCCRMHLSQDVLQ